MTIRADPNYAYAVSILSLGFAMFFAGMWAGSTNWLADDRNQRALISAILAGCSAVCWYMAVAAELLLPKAPFLPATSNMAAAACAMGAAAYL